MENRYSVLIWTQSIINTILLAQWPFVLISGRAFHHPLHDLCEILWPQLMSLHRHVNILKTTKACFLCTRNCDYYTCIRYFHLSVVVVELFGFNWKRSGNKASFPCEEKQIFRGSFLKQYFETTPNTYLS